MRLSFQSSSWFLNLSNSYRFPPLKIVVCTTAPFWPSPPPLLYVPVCGVLVELAELPVDGEDVHVVVLLEVMSQQVQGVVASLQPLLVLIDLLHLEDPTHTHGVKFVYWFLPRYVRLYHNNTSP